MWPRLLVTSRGCVSRRASCTSPRTGIDARRSRTCSTLPSGLGQRRPTVSRAGSPRCRTSRRWRQHLRRAARRAVRPRLRSAALRRDEHVLRGAAARPTRWRSAATAAITGPDCKQVCLALVVTREGMPLGYEVFAGNRTDVTTVEEIVETMEVALRDGRAHLGDGSGHDERGQPGLAAGRPSGAISSARPKSELQKWAAAPLAEAAAIGRPVREGIEAKRCLGPDGVRDVRADPLRRAP